ncbi:hypothetical protein Tco_1355948, partial [Tanacetum coccineum]
MRQDLPPLAEVNSSMGCNWFRNGYTARMWTRMVLLFSSVNGAICFRLRVTSIRKLKKRMRMTSNTMKSLDALLLLQTWKWSELAFWTAARKVRKLNLQ